MLPGINFKCKVLLDKVLHAVYIKLRFNFKKPIGNVPYRC